jgi:hypothetical protein
MSAATARPLPGSGVAANLGADAVFPIPVQGRRLSVSAVWTGTPTGTFSLETSFDNANWYVVPGAAAEFTANSQAQPAGGGSSAVWNWDNVPGSMVRLKYTRTSGTGVATLLAAFGR